jgi:peroxiredoxin
MVMVLAAAAGACSDSRFVRVAEERRWPVVGAAAPDYGGVDLHGDTVRLAQLRGSVVLLTAWATWCGPCIREMPLLEGLHRRWSDSGLVVLGVSIDRQSPDRIERFLRERGATYASLKDDEVALGNAFNWGRGVPKTIVIDRDGLIAGIFLGGLDAGRSAELEQLVESAADGRRSLGDGGDGGDWGIVDRSIWCWPRRGTALFRLARQRPKFEPRYAAQACVAPPFIPPIPPIPLSPKRWRSPLAASS